MSDAQEVDFQLDRILNETFVQRVDFHQQLASTNDRAMQMAADSTWPRPLLVLAENQTGGRGRGTNQWWSTEGSLTFSILAALGDLPAERIPQLSLTVGLALCQALESIAPRADLALKWPNDVFLEQRKLAGILIELPTQPPREAVIGVGINVNNSLQDAPAEVQASAISLCDCLETPLELTDVLISCLHSLDRQLRSLQDHRHSLADQWRAYHLLQGKNVELEAYSRTVSGVCIGIDDDGALLLETETGIARFLGGVITRFGSA